MTTHLERIFRCGFEEAMERNPELINEELMDEFVKGKFALTYYSG